MNAGQTLLSRQHGFRSNYYINIMTLPMNKVKIFLMKYSHYFLQNLAARNIRQNVFLPVQSAAWHKS